MVEFSVNVRRFAALVLGFCVATEIAFVPLDWHVNYGRLIRVGAIERLFNATREDGLASWFAVTQTFLVGLTSWAIFKMRHRLEPDVWRPYGWAVISMFFFYMSVDDGAEIHERLGTTFEVLNEGSDALAGTLLDSFPSYAWQIVLLPLFSGLGMFTLWFLWREFGGDGRLRLLVLAAIGCFVVAVGMDFVEGLDPGHPANVYTRITQTWDLRAYTMHTFGRTPFVSLRHFSKVLEESIEMLGNSLLWYLFLRRLGGSAQEIRVRLASAVGR